MSKEIIKSGDLVCVTSGAYEVDVLGLFRAKVDIEVVVQDEGLEAGRALNYAQVEKSLEPVGVVTLWTGA